MTSATGTTCTNHQHTRGGVSCCSPSRSSSSCCAHVTGRFSSADASTCGRGCVSSSPSSRSLAFHLCTSLASHVLSPPCPGAPDGFWPGGGLMEFLYLMNGIDSMITSPPLLPAVSVATNRPSPEQQMAQLQHPAVVRTCSSTLEAHAKTYKHPTPTGKHKTCKCTTAARKRRQIERPAHHSTT